MSFIRTETARFFTYVGSLATDPICSAHKHFVYLTLGKNRIYPKSSSLVLVANKVAALTKCIPLFLIGIPAGAIGIASRFIANLISPNSFIYKKGNAQEIPAKSNPSVFKWNICGIGGGYPTYQNGLKPWDERFNEIVAKVKSQKADTIFLEEVYDYKLGLKLFEALKGEYAHFYFNIGAKAIGAPGGLFLASKGPVSNPRFKIFPASTSLGSIVFVGKGLFSFDSGKFSFHHTHFQHSENLPDKTPIAKVKERREKEVNARKRQADIVLREALKPNEIKQHHVFLGDLNMDPKELKSSRLMKYFQDPPNLGKCSYFPIEKFSKELKEERKIKNEGSFIDYILLNRKSGSIKTQLVKAFSLTSPEKNISDHHGLLSTLKIGSIFQTIFSYIPFFS